MAGDLSLPDQPEQIGVLLVIALQRVEALEDVLPRRFVYLSGGGGGRYTQKVISSTLT